MNLKPRMPRQLLVSSLVPEENHLNVRNVCDQGRDTRKKHIAEAVLNNWRIALLALLYMVDTSELFPLLLHYQMHPKRYILSLCNVKSMLIMVYYFPVYISKYPSCQDSITVMSQFVFVNMQTIWRHAQEARVCLGPDSGDSFSLVFPYFNPK